MIVTTSTQNRDHEQGNEEQLSEQADHAGLHRLGDRALAHTVDELAPDQHHQRRQHAEHRHARERGHQRQEPQRGSAERHEQSTEPHAAPGKPPEIEVASAHVDELAADTSTRIAAQRSSDDHRVALHVCFRTERQAPADRHRVPGHLSVHPNRAANRDDIAIDDLVLIHRHAAAEPDSIVSVVSRPPGPRERSVWSLGWLRWLGWPLRSDGHTAKQSLSCLGIEIRQPEHEIRIRAKPVPQLGAGRGGTVDVDGSVDELNRAHAVAVVPGTQSQAVPEREHLEPPLDLAPQRVLLPGPGLRGGDTTARHRERAQHGDRSGQGDAFHDGVSSSDSDSSSRCNPYSAAMPTSTRTARATDAAGVVRPPAAARPIVARTSQTLTPTPIDVAIHTHPATSSSTRRTNMRPSSGSTTKIAAAMRLRPATVTPAIRASLAAGRSSGRSHFIYVLRRDAVVECCKTGHDGRKSGRL